MLKKALLCIIALVASAQAFATDAQNEQVAQTQSSEVAAKPEEKTQSTEVTPQEGAVAPVPQAPGEKPAATGEQPELTKEEQEQFEKLIADLVKAQEEEKAAKDAKKK